MRCLAWAGSSNRLWGMQGSTALVPLRLGAHAYCMYALVGRHVYRPIPAGDVQVCLTHSTRVPLTWLCRSG